MANLRDDTGWPIAVIMIGVLGLFIGWPIAAAIVENNNETKLEIARLQAGCPATELPE